MTDAPGLVEPTVMDDCWNKIGVGGDRSCPLLDEHIHCKNCPTFASAARSFFDRPAPEGYLAEWSELVARPIPVTSVDDSGLLVFRLGLEWLAMGLGFVSEVTTIRPVHRVPHRTNRVFSGLVALRGQLQLCVSMHGLLNVDLLDPSTEASTNPRLVVIRKDADIWAFPVEEVAGVHRVPRDKLLKVPSTIANPAGSFGRAVFAWGEGRSVDLLDEPRVFAALRRMGA